MDNGTCNCVTLPLLFSRLSLLRLGSAPSVVVPIQTAPASNKFFFTILLIFIENSSIINKQVTSFFFFVIFFKLRIEGGGGLQNILASISIKEFNTKKKKSEKKKETLKKNKTRFNIRYFDKFGKPKTAVLSFNVRVLFHFV